MRKKIRSKGGNRSHFKQYGPWSLHKTKFWIGCRTVCKWVVETHFFSAYVILHLHVWLNKSTLVNKNTMSSILILKAHHSLTCYHGNACSRYDAQIILKITSTTFSCSISRYHKSLSLCTLGPFFQRKSSATLSFRIQLMKLGQTTNLPPNYPTRWPRNSHISPTAVPWMHQIALPLYREALLPLHFANLREYSTQYPVVTYLYIKNLK